MLTQVRSRSAPWFASTAMNQCARLRSCFACQIGRRPISPFRMAARDPGPARSAVVGRYRRNLFRGNQVAGITIPWIGHSVQLGRTRPQARSLCATSAPTPARGTIETSKRAATCGGLRLPFECRRLVVIPPRGVLLRPIRRTVFGTRSTRQPAQSRVHVVQHRLDFAVSLLVLLVGLLDQVHHSRAVAIHSFPASKPVWIGEGLEGSRLAQRNGAMLHRVAVAAVGVARRRESGGTRAPVVAIVWRRP